MNSQQRIYSKIIEVRKAVEFLQKDTQGFQYRYVSGSNVLGSIRPIMDKVGLILMTSIENRKQDRFQWEGKDSKGQPKIITQFVVTFEMRMIWIDAEDPSGDRIVTTWISSGEDEDPAKANGKAHTYGERYYLLKFFNIPTDNEDPDAFQRKQEKSGNIPETKKEAITPTITLRSMLEEQALVKFKTMDAFKMWRTDNDLPEKLDGLSDLQLAQIMTKVREYKK